MNDYDFNSARIMITRNQGQREKSDEKYTGAHTIREWDEKLTSEICQICTKWKINSDYNNASYLYSVTCIKRTPADTKIEPLCYIKPALSGHF